jgi:hypothetical protein
VRPWIFGWRGNPDLPDGVVFEGVAGGAPTHLRGETGAQSTIVPSLDAVLGLRHREDALHVMLAELEAYRPAAHRAYLAALRRAVYGAGTDVGAGGAAAAAAAEVGAGAAVQQPAPPPQHRLRDFVVAAGSPGLAAAFNACVGLVWAFRAIHVTFADMYIARYTDAEAATGGTPYKVRGMRGGRMVVQRTPCDDLSPTVQPSHLPTHPPTHPHARAQAYLRKHRDESIAQQIDTYGPATLCAWEVPPHDVEQAHVSAVVHSRGGHGRAACECQCLGGAPYTRIHTLLHPLPTPSSTHLPTQPRRSRRRCRRARPTASRRSCWCDTATSSPATDAATRRWRPRCSPRRAPSPSGPCRTPATSR